MLTRCRNKNIPNYKDYGGRGIKVCERWLEFENFLEDMGKMPKGKYSIDRIDNDGDYCPENCRWATDHQQANNKRCSCLIEFNGEILTVTQWARKLNIDRASFRERLKKMPMEQAINCKRRNW